MTPLSLRRVTLFPTSTSHSLAQSICADLLSQARRSRPQIRAQALDVDQLLRLNLTLNRQVPPDEVLPGIHAPANHLSAFPTILYGTPLPPGYHLAYFTPTCTSDALGPDGTDLAFSPPAPFTRRMWAGGQITWNRDSPLTVGPGLATETSRLVSAVVKKNGAGEEMIVVGVEKEYRQGEGEGEVGLVDRRDWVFRETLPQGTAEASVARQEKENEGQRESWSDEEIEAMLPTKLDSDGGATVKTRDFRETATSLFRFSALTFNAHMIHYSRDWARQMEGQRDIVVHGPLNLIHMLDLWRDSQQGNRDAIPTSISYRATAPFYVGERYRGILEAEGGKTVVRLWGIDGKGGSKVGMMGDIVD